MVRWLKNLRPRFGGGTGPFPERTVEVVEGLVRDLFAENHGNVLLHGDFHHFNILLSGRGWLAVDPKGVWGPAEYEAGPFIMNPWGAMPVEADAILRTQRRIAILSENFWFRPAETFEVGCLSQPAFSLVGYGRRWVRWRIFPGMD